MRRWALLTPLVIAGLGLISVAVENGLQTFTIVQAQQKTRDRVLLYLVNTPIYQQDPYFEVVVRAGDQILAGERDLEHKWEALPVDWVPGARVEGRVDKHYLYLRQPNGTYLRFIITSRTRPPAGK